MENHLNGGNSFGVDVVLSESLADHPLCEHGPTLLFERFFKNKPSQRFFACSACRDRKLCSFFQLQDERITNGKNLVQKEIKKKLYKKKKPRLMSAGDGWCWDCSCGYPHSLAHPHKEHTVKQIDETQLASPTIFLNPMDNKKCNAQYFFTEDSCRFFFGTAKRLCFTNVLCIGAPRFHEFIKQSKLDIKSLLLDIDARFEQFYPSTSFIRYNMFNNFFFDNTGEGQVRLNKFLVNATIENTLMVIDPPFGCQPSLLAQLIATMWRMTVNGEIATMLVFPYFFEHHVETCISALKMLDFKVSYTNHKQYNNSSQRGSPVRVFTNIPVERVKMPLDKYRFCKICQRYVYKENTHCKLCKRCPSKDGRTYVHCNECRTCVKPDRVHCSSCMSCELAKHECKRKALSACHVCGELTHKRKYCPSIVHQQSNECEMLVNAKKRKKTKGQAKAKPSKTIC